MANIDRAGACVALAGILLLGGTAHAVSPADECEAAKLKVAGKYGFCRMKAEAKSVEAGNPVDYTKCESKFGRKWLSSEAKAGIGVCPTEGDLVDIQGAMDDGVGPIAPKLTGIRFVANGDGTVTDVQTGLQWEQKDDSGGIHDKDRNYTWTDDADADFTDSDVTAFTEFLDELNNCESADGSTATGGFAGHCDWRLPTIGELQTILLEPFPCSTNPCIDPIFGPTFASGYWSSTTQLGFPNEAWFVFFDDGFVSFTPKSFFSFVRAVRVGP